jgi:hypothetical protein
VRGAKISEPLDNLLERSSDICAVIALHQMPLESLARGLIERAVDQIVQLGPNVRACELGNRRDIAGARSDAVVAARLPVAFLQRHARPRSWKFALSRA